MFNPEKPKGLPGTRGIVYLVTGIVIGVVGVLGVMFVLMLPSPSCACEPPPTTTIPLIPTPIPGATGTSPASAQRVPGTISLVDFHVDEGAGIIGLSYKKALNGATFMEMHPWSSDGIGERKRSAGSSFPPDNSSYLSVLSPLYVSPTSSEMINTLTPKKNEAGQVIDQMGLFSIGGRWLVSLHVSGMITLTDSALDTEVELTVQGVARLASFSPDGTRLAITSRDKIDAGREYIDVFHVSNLLTHQTYGFEGVITSPVVFSRDNTHLAFMVDQGLRVISLSDDEQTYFDVGAPTPHLTIDTAAQWVAVPSEGSRVITFYSLDTSKPLSPSPTLTQTIRMNDEVSAMQFVDEGLLVGEKSGTITLYRWTGQLWGDPRVMLTTADLE